MEVTDRPQEQAECLDEKKSYEDMTESPRKCVKVLICRWELTCYNISEHFPWDVNCSWAAFVAKKKNEIWYLMFSEHYMSMSANLKKLYSLECTYIRFLWDIPEFWMFLVEVPALPSCPVSDLQHLHYDLITLPPALPQLQTDHIHSCRLKLSITTLQRQSSTDLSRLVLIDLGQ